MQQIQIWLTNFSFFCLFIVLCLDSSCWKFAKVTALLHHGDLGYLKSQGYGELYKKIIHCFMWSAIFFLFSSLFCVTNNERLYGSIPKNPNPKNFKSWKQMLGRSQGYLSENLVDYTPPEISRDIFHLWLLGNSFFTDTVRVSVILCT